MDSRFGTLDREVVKMKCDELKYHLMLNKERSWNLCYIKSEVDEAIAEIKKEIHRKEGVQQRWFERCMEARGENFKLKRALWIARANRALEKIAWFKLWNASISTMNPEDCARQEFDKWKKNLGKFLKKEEEYK